MLLFHGQAAPFKDGEQAPVLRQHLRHESGDALIAGDGGEVAQQAPGQALAVVIFLNVKATSALRWPAPGPRTTYRPFAMITSSLPFNRVTIRATALSKSSSVAALNSVSVSARSW
jgi:hypothetical protein